MAKIQQTVTDNIQAYTECLEAIHRFLDEVRTPEGEAWIEANNFKPLVASVTAFEQLLRTFTEQANKEALCPPESLIGCPEILRRGLGEGDPRVHVRVASTYVL